MTMHLPGSDQRADLRVVRDPSLSGGSSGTPDQALGLLENARRVADATVGEARAEAERLLAAARERAQQVQRDARELADRMRAEAEREAAQVRHQAFGEAERIVGDARAQVSTLQSSLGALQSSRDDTVATVRGLVGALSRVLADHAPRAGDDPGDRAQHGQHSAQGHEGQHSAQGHQSQGHQSPGHQSQGHQSQGHLGTYGHQG